LRKKKKENFNGLKKKRWFKVELKKEKKTILVNRWKEMIKLKRKVT